MKTLDGHTLQDGDLCWVCIDVPGGQPQKTFMAFYRDEIAVDVGLDFTIPSIEDDAIFGVTHVWKYRPNVHDLPGRKGSGAEAVR